MSFGPELLANGDFSLSTGIGAASSIGPGWVSSYIPCGPNLFAPPCTAGRFAFFTTNASQVTLPAFAAIPALGGRSMAVNVSTATAVPIIEWLNIPLVNGTRYRLQVNAAIMSNPFSVAMRIDGGANGNFPIPAPPVTLAWQLNITEFVFTGPTGLHSVGLYSNTGAASGNDHTFDDFSLREVTGAPIPCACCPISLCGIGSPNAPTFFAPLGSNQGGVVGPVGTFTFANFAGSGVTATVVIVGDTSALDPNDIAIGPSPPRLVTGTITFSSPVYLRRLGLTDLDFPGLDEQAGNFNPQRSGVYGQKMNQACGATFVEATPAQNPMGCVKGTVNNDTGGVTFPSPLTSSLTWQVSRAAAGAGHFVTELGFDLVPPVMVSACRDATGIHWYTEDGVEVPAADVTPCENPGPNTFTPPVPTPLAVTNLLMNGVAFGDDAGGLGENLCAITPAPTSMVGFSPVGAGVGCLNPANGANSLTWAGPLSTVAMEYSANGGTTSGASLMQFSATGIPSISWPAKAVPLTLGQSWNSLPLTGGGYARITATTPPSAGLGVSFDGGINVRLNGAFISWPNYGFKLEFFA